MIKPKLVFSFAALLAVIGAGFQLFPSPDDDLLSSLPAPNEVISVTPSRVAITIDDLPYVMPSKTSPEDGLKYVERIASALQDHGIIATGFAVGQQINAISEPALHAFKDAGHTIGNHSWSHPDYGTLTAEEFLTETRATHDRLEAWIDGPRFYRFPYLREGETEDAKAAAETILKDLGYQNVPVTIDNDEWQFNAAYLEAWARDDANAAEKIADAYVLHMQERTGYFQNLAQRELGMEVDHILLIHLNRLNADHLGTLLDWYAQQGWAFITVEQALMHPVYALPDIYAGPRGLSQIERVLGGRKE